MFHHPTLNRSEVIALTNIDKLTNKQTPLKTSTSLGYATPVGKNNYQFIVIPHLHDTTCCQTGCTTGLSTGCIV